jgi:hypothetical protein
MEDDGAIRACIVIAGGGSYATSSILSIPGASSVLLESVVVYDRKSFGEYVSRNTPDVETIGTVKDGRRRRWLTVMEEHVAQWKGGTIATNNDDVSFVTSDTDYIDMNVKRESSFQFSSIEAAMLLSHSALRRSINLSSNFADRCLRSTGVGCTSSLVAGPGEGRKGRKSRAYIACSTLTHGTWVWELELDSGEGNCRRSRLEEELVVSNAVLLAMVRCREKNKQSFDSPMDKIDDDIDSLLRMILNREGDTFTEKWMQPYNFNTYLSREGSRAVASGASRIIDGLADIVAILPIIDDQAVRMQPLLLDCDIPIPRDVLILPGSYNPPHVGHVGLANAAVMALKRLRRKEKSEREDGMSSTMLQNLWDTVDEHNDRYYDPTVLFEISVTNVDKPPLKPMEVLRRVDLFASLSLSSTIDMPKDWAVILTNAPLFSQKTDIIDRLIVSDEPRNELRRRMSFVIGTDTMVRIINPKYYSGIREDMISSLLQMKERGVHFIVGGRVDNSTFVNGEDEVMSLPMEIQEMFTLLTEDEFRLDISSTELRAKLGPIT